MLILASTSKIRAAILRNAGIAFEVQAPLTDETELKLKVPQRSGEQLALRLAEAKSLSLATRHPEALILGADQVLVCDGRIYDKPRNLHEAREHLAALSGKPHNLVSALYCSRHGAKTWSHVGIATLHMRALTPAAIDRYLAKIGNDALTSVGTYKLEGLGVQLFDNIEGDYFTILGLPLLPLLAYLRAAGELEE